MSWSFNTVNFYNPYACGKDCENRKIGCQGSCERHQKFRAWNEERKEAMKKERFTDDVCAKSRADACKRGGYGKIRRK